MNAYFPLACFALSTCFAASELYAQSAVQATNEPLHVVVKLSGVLSPTEALPVEVEMKSGIAPKIESFAKHGHAVAKGDTLLTLETKELDDAITDAEANFRLAQLSLEQAERSLHALERSIELDQSGAEHDREVATEAWEYFQQIGKEATIQDWRQSVTSSEHALQYAQEELKQLEKMYDADDLTEESEEIVLKRARNDVAQAEHYLNRVQREAKRALEIELPRTERSLREAAERALIRFESNKPVFKEALLKAKTELEQQRLAMRRQEKKLDELREDRKRCTLTAPASGVVYHGYERQGQWKTEHLAPGLDKGLKLPLGNPQFTIVNQSDLMLTTSVAEEDLWHLRVNSAGRLVPKSAPREKLSCRVVSIESAPNAVGAFEAKVLVQNAGTATQLAAGMRADAEFVVYSNANALMAPSSYVLVDHGKGGTRFVWLKMPDGKVEKREVVIGYASGDKLEILEGLAVGDTLLTGEEAAKGAATNTSVESQPASATKPADPSAPTSPSSSAAAPATNATEPKE